MDIAPVAGEYLHERKKGPKVYKIYHIQNKMACRCKKHYVTNCEVSLTSVKADC